MFKMQSCDNQVKAWIISITYLASGQRLTYDLNLGMLNHSVEIERQNRSNIPRYSSLNMPNEQKSYHNNTIERLIKQCIATSL